MSKALSLVGLLAMVVGIIGLGATHNLFSWNPVTLVLQALAIVLMVWARVTFGARSFHAAANPTAGGLVDTGPYHYIRHPIYTAVCLFALGGIVAHPSALSATLGALLLAGSLTRMLCEERLLREAMPEYAEYAKKTRRMIPGVY
jgi:protein-S-isoprenylcysteine O-methyltransferase Ste14